MLQVRMKGQGMRLKIKRIYSILLTPAEAGTRLSDPGEMQRWVDLVGWLHTAKQQQHPFNGPFSGLPRWADTRKVKDTEMIIQLPEDSHPPQY